MYFDDVMAVKSYVVVLYGLVGRYHHFGEAYFAPLKHWYICAITHKTTQYVCIHE
jgi:hypothetical protein